MNTEDINYLFMYDSRYPGMVRIKEKLKSKGIDCRLKHVTYSMDIGSETYLYLVIREFQ